MDICDLLNLAEASYFKKSEQPHLPADWCLLRINEESPHAFQAVSAKKADSNDIVIAFKGSDTIRGRLAGTRVLNGMQPKASAEALSFVQSHIDQFAHHQIWLTGHSLGGTLAQFVAATVPERVVARGASFGGAGVPGLEKQADCPEFTSYIAYGDGLGLFGSDTWVGEHLEISRQSHFGTVMRIGNPQDDKYLRGLSRLSSFVSSSKSKPNEDKEIVDKSIGYRSILDSPTDYHSITHYGYSLKLNRSPIFEEVRNFSTTTNKKIAVKFQVGWTAWSSQK